MGLRRPRKRPEWSPYEIKVTKKMTATKSVNQIAKLLGRSHGLVSMKISEMGLKTPKPNYWSNEEIKLIKKLYPTKTAAEIASRLGRSVLVVRGKVFELGLKKYKIAR
jgi:DNA-binding CsgD family transcriptional regulator